MKRRRVLASIGSLGTLATAGCVAGESGTVGAGGDGQSTTPPKRDDPTTTPGDPGSPGDEVDWGPESPEPFESTTVGSRDGVAFPGNNGPHDLRVWNGADERRTLGLTLSTPGGTALERTLQFPADGWIRVRLNEPAAYELAVAVNGERAGTVTVGRKWFDCNASGTTVAVNAEGAVDATSFSTAMACPGPAVAGRSFQRREGRCGTGGEASVAFNDESVVVTGSVRAPTPCYDLALESVELSGAEEYADGSDEVLALTVATDGRREGACVDCVGAVDYEARVAFENGYPSNVRVVHGSTGDRRTVREVSRRS